MDDRMWIAVLVSAAAGFWSVAAQVPSTPCPDIFQYVRGPGNVWRGHILVWPPPRSSQITVVVHVFLTAALPNKYAGRLMLSEDKDIVAQRLLAGSKERIGYDLLFPLTSPLPTIDRITVNQDVICKGPRVSAPIMTKISIEHTLISAMTPSSGTNNVVPGGNNVVSVATPGPPTGRLEEIYPWLNWEIFRPKPQVPQKPQSFNRPDWPFLHPNTSPPNFSPPPQPLPPPTESPVQRPPPTQQSTLSPVQPPTKPPWQPPVQTENLPPWESYEPITLPPIQIPQKVEQKTKDVCGRSVIANELIINGKRTSRGEWPWIAAIFFSSSVGQLQFQCGATLFNKQHVITAGHCLRLLDEDNTYTDVHPSQLVVYIGIYSLRRIADAYSQPREVEQIFIHPDFRATSSFDADVAVLKLANSIEYTQYVRPICLWPFVSDLAPVVGKLGTVVGWGMNEEGHKSTNEPRKTEVPIVSQLECLRNKTEFVSITSERTFCAGFRNDTGPCNGDSGSGLILKYFDGKVSRWYLRGITSVSLYNRAENRCDLRNYVVFTDVAKFSNWMKQFTKDEFI